MESFTDTFQKLTGVKARERRPSIAGQQRATKLIETDHQSLLTVGGFFLRLLAGFKYKIIPIIVGYINMR